MWERRKPSVCGHQNCSVCKYSYSTWKCVIYPKAYFKTMSIWWTLVRSLLWQRLCPCLAFIPSVCFWLCPCVVVSAVLCCCAALVCSAALLLQLLNRFPYLDDEYLLSSLSLSLSLSPHPSPSHCELQVTQQTHKYKAMATCSCAIFTHSCYSNGSHLYIFPTSCCHSLLFLPISLFLPLSTVAVSVLWSRDGIT